ncbi:MAG: hypothetical protein AMS27_16965 [Bacteroides sp. SM23_62_1]|nr:MAG: hypothetical protein AMS27_16965 [Bacteroides sp. SM23_62_1]
MTLFPTISGQDWLEIIYSTSQDGTGYDNFGKSVSISGDYAIIGAPGQNYDADGNNYMSGSGAAYIFKRDISGSWLEFQKLVASDRGQWEYFGYSVDISGDYAIIGAWGATKDNAGLDSLVNTGAAYIFKKDANDTWIQLKRILSNTRNKSDYFGYSVCISGDYAIVGARYEDHDANGTDSLNSSGSAYIFYKNQDGTDNWGLQKKIVAGDRKATAQFGYSVSISDHYVIVGAHYETTDAGGSNSLTGAGAAYIFYKDKNGTNAWGQVKKIVPSDREASDKFGNAVSISGKYAIVGAYMEDHDADGNNFLDMAGSAYIFTKDKNGLDQWGQVQKLVASDREAEDEFGYSVFISGDYTIVGAPFEDPSTGGSFPTTNAGSSYMFRKDIAGTWIQEQKIVASLGQRGDNDHCGSSVCVNNGNAIAGAPGRDRSLFMWKSFQADKITIGRLNSNDATINWENGSGTSRAVFMRQGTTGSAQPENNTTYNADISFGNGSKIGTSDWYCIYNGTGNSAVVNGLTENTQYRVMVCEYIGTPGDELYEDTTLSENPINFTTINHTWNEEDNFTNTATDFSRSVSISGNYAIVGTDNHEAAYIYEKDENGIWKIAQYISAGDSTTGNRFGYSVGISGNWAIVGAFNNSTDPDGNNPVSLAGAAYLFKRDEITGLWNQEQKIVASDRETVEQGGFGWAVSISGNRAIIGAKEYSSGFLLGSAYIFHYDGNNWTEAGKIVPDDQGWNDDDQELGYSVSISGDYAVIGAPRDDYDTLQANYVWMAGAAYIYKWDGNNWVKDKKIFAADRQDGDYFGISVSISGEYVIVGAYQEDHDQDGNVYLGNAGSAYIFKRNGVTGKWEDFQKIVNQDREAGDAFGISVSIADDYALIGAFREEDDQNGNNNIAGAGSVYLFTRTTEPSETWEQFVKIVPGDRSVIGTNAYFGESVSLSGESFVVGAPDVKKVYFFSNKIQSGNISGSPKSTEMTINWVRGNGVKRVVFVKEAGTGYPFPTDNLTYSADTVLGNGDQAGSAGWYCVYNGSGSTVTVSGLDPSTQYRVMVLDYNGESGAEVYYTGTALNNPSNITTGMDLTGVDIDVAGGIITGTTTNMQYSLNSTNGIDGDWAYCTNGNTAVSFVPGVVYMRQADLISNHIPVATLAPPAAAPSYSIDFYVEKTAQTIPNTVEYNFDNNFSTTNLSGDGTSITLTPGQDVYFRLKATQSTLPSLIQTLEVPGRPVVPALSINYPSETTIESIPKTIEYNDDNDFNTENNTGSGTVINLIPGVDKYFRIPASDTNFVSTVKTLIVPARPAATNYSIHFSNETTVENVTALDEYSTNPDMTGSTPGIYQPVALNPGIDLYIRSKATTTEFAGEIQHLVVPERPSVPVVSLSDKNSVMARFKKSADGTGSDVSVLDGLEFTMDNGGSWNTILDITTVDASGPKTILVRKKATASSFKSLATGNLDYETPLATLMASTGCNGLDDYINIRSNIDTGIVYLVLEGEPQETKADFNNAVTDNKGSKLIFKGANIDLAISTKDLLQGTYNAYIVSILDSISDKSSSSVSIYDIPELDLGPDIVKCEETTVTLKPDSEYALYSWNYNDATTQSITVSDEDDYVLTVTDGHGCRNTDMLSVRYNIPYQDEQICVVTIDLTTGKNIIVWEKTPDIGILAYNIYRESTIGVYNIIGTVPVDELSIFKDTTGNPESQSYLYKITVVDSCGKESLLASSKYHRPSFLQYVSSEGGVNLEWTDYNIQGVADIGAYLTSYAIYRGTDSTGLVEYQIVGSINTYTDIDPNALKRRYYYRVAALLKDPCIPTAGKKADSGPYSHSMSNIEDNRLQDTAAYVNDVLIKMLNIYPNPFSDMTTIRFDNPDGNHYSMYVTDLTGKVVYFEDNILTDQIEFSREGIPSGYYFVELRGTRLFRGRMIIE